MLYTELTTSALVIMLVVIAGVLMVTDRTRTLRPFDRETTIPLRGLLAIFIVASHSVTPWLYSLGLPSVAIFFFLSGYGLCMSYKHKKGNYLKGFLSKRCSKLLPAFVALTLICVMSAILIDGQHLSALLKQMSNGQTILPNSWFIFAILYIYVAFYLSALLGKTLLRTGFLLICFILIYIFLTREVGHWGHYWYTSILTVILGYYIALYEDSIDRLVMRHTLAVYLTAVAMVFLSFYGKIILILHIPSPFEIWLGFWGISLALACYLIIRTLGTIKWKPLVWLGGISMEIYLVHGMLLMYIGKALGGFDQSLNTFTFICYVILVYTLSIFAAWIIHKIFDRHRR